MIYTWPVTPDQRLLGHICFYIILTAPDRPDRGLVLNTGDDVISIKKSSMSLNNDTHYLYNLSYYRVM